MNKYLEKIAAKVELEPGVNYDLAKHDIAVSRQRMSEHINSKDQTSRLITGGMFGALGGVGGTLTLMDKIKNDNAASIQSGAADFKRPPGMKFGTREHIQSMMEAELHARRNPVPATNMVGRLASKYGIGRVLGAGKVLGGVAGAAAMGGLGYFAGGLEDTAKADYKNSYLHHLEKKHDAKINELEGWD